MKTAYVFCTAQKEDRKYRAVSDHVWSAYFRVETWYIARAAPEMLTVDDA